MNEIEQFVSGIYQRAENHAKMLFEIFDLKSFQNHISLFPDEKAEEIKKWRRQAIREFQNNKFVDKSQLLPPLDVSIIIQGWDDFILRHREEGGGEFYIKQIPPEFIQYPEKYIFETYCNAMKQKLIIDYLNGLLQPKMNVTGFATPYSQDQLKDVYKAYKNIYLRTTPESKFMAAFSPAKLPDEWTPINWTGAKSHIRYFVTRLTGADAKPQRLSEIFTPKVDSNDKAKPVNLKKKLDTILR